MTAPSARASQLTFQPLHPCPLCRTEERQRLFPVPVHQGTLDDGKAITLYECRGCGLRYFDPCLTPESMGSIYKSSEDLGQRCTVHQAYYEYGELEKWTRTLRDFNRGLEKLEAGGKPGAIFEVGYGSGLFLALARKRGWSADGIDTSRQNQDLARTKFQMDLRQGDCNALTGLDERFGAAAAWDVLEHQSDPNGFLSRIRGLLKPGGRILIAAPNDASFLRFLCCGLYRASFGKLDQGVRKIYVLEHIAYYNFKTLGRILRQNGFEVEDHFFSSTDLDRYQFSLMERLAASAILAIGKFLFLENRLIMTARKI